MYIRRKMYSIGYDENDLYEVEQRAFSNGFACAERLFGEGDSPAPTSTALGFGDEFDDENWLKRAWKYGFGNKASQKERKDLIKKYMDQKAKLAYANEAERKNIKAALKSMYGDTSEKALSKEQKKLRKALMATKLGKAGIIGGSALGAGALGYGAYRASQD